MREFLFVPIPPFLALLISYDYWKCLREIGTEGRSVIAFPPQLTTIAAHPTLCAFRQMSRP